MSDVPLRCGDIEEIVDRRVVASVGFVTVRQIGTDDINGQAPVPGIRGRIWHEPLDSARYRILA